MLKTLFKPKWQHKKADVRVKAISHLSGDSDILVTLAEQDPEQQVRLQAIKQLNVVRCLLQLSDPQTVNHQHSIHNAGISPTRAETAVLCEAAQKRLQVLFKQQCLSSAEIEQAYPYIKTNALALEVAQSSEYSATLRKQIIGQLTDAAYQSVLFSIANTDTAKEVQFAAAQQLTDYEQIKKLEKHTKNNKRLRQFLKEKAEQYRQEQAQLTALETLCVQLEKLGSQDKWEQDRTRLLSLQKQWDDYELARIPSKFKARYIAACQAFSERFAIHKEKEKALLPYRQQQQAVLDELDGLFKRLSREPEQYNTETLPAAISHLQEQWQACIKQPLPQAEQALNQTYYQQSMQRIQALSKTLMRDFQSLAQLIALNEKAEQCYQDGKAINQKRIKQIKQQWNSTQKPNLLDYQTQKVRYQKIINRLDDFLLRQEKAQEAQLNSLRDSVIAMEQALNEDQLKTAIDYHKQAQRALQQLSHIPTHVLKTWQQRVQHATPKIREAQDWRHWGTDQAREQLIDAAKQLIADTEIDPLQREKTLRDLRAQWKSLTQVDPQQHQKLWEAFDQACTQAYQPCKVYHETQAQQRQHNLVQREKVCAQLELLEQEEVDWERPPSELNWKAINESIQQYRKAWKDAGTVDRKQWKPINERFNAAMDALEVHLAKERRRNFVQREGLIAQADKLQEMDDLGAAIEAAKALQAAWQTTITGKQSEEQKLWKRFRASINAVFDRQKAIRQANKAAEQEQLSEKEALLNEVTTWLSLEGELFLQQFTEFADKELAFDHIEMPRHKQDKLRKRWQQVRKALQQKADRVGNQQRYAQLVLLCDKANYCRRLECEQSSAKQPDDIQQAWQALAPLSDKKLESKIQARFASAQAQPTNQALLLNLLLELEMHFELETPADYQAARMAYQVQRLSEMMLSANKSAEDQRQEAEHIMQRYLLTAQACLADTEQLNARFAKIMQHYGTVMTDVVEHEEEG
ncbi:MAG: DUF349 domain-containing protein [bacterium]